MVWQQMVCVHMYGMCGVCVFVVYVVCSVHDICVCVARYVMCMYIVYVHSMY